MSDDNKPAPTSTPAPSDNTPGPDNSTPTAPPKPSPVDMTSDQLKQRLTEEREKARSVMLKDFGFEKADDLKGALAKLRDLETASLSEKEKLEKTIADLAPKAKRADTLAELFKAQVDQDFAGLPENVQKAIDETAGGDPEQRFALMSVIKKSGLLAQPSSPPKPAPPANTTPNPAPPPSNAQSKFDEWQQMSKRSPMLGDIFYQQNQREIERTRPAA